MNKTFKISLLLSVMAISCIAPSTRCMDTDLEELPTEEVGAAGEVERDALEVALEQIDRMPDDFSALIPEERELYIFTELIAYYEGFRRKEVLTPTQAEGYLYAETIANRLAKKYGKEVVSIDVVTPFSELLYRNSEYLNERINALLTPILFPDDTTSKGKEEIEAALQKRIMAEPKFVDRLALDSPEIQELFEEIISNNRDQEDRFRSYLKAKVAENREKVIIFPLVGVKCLPDVYMLIEDLPEEDRPFIVIDCPICLEAELVLIEKIEEEEEFLLLLLLAEKLGHDGFEFSSNMKMILLVKRFSVAQLTELNQVDLFEEGFVIVNTQHCLNETREKTERLSFIREKVLGELDQDTDVGRVAEIGFTRETARSRESVVANLETERATIRVPKSFLLAFS